MTAESLLKTLKKELTYMPENEYEKWIKITEDPDFVSLGPHRVDIWLEKLKKGGE